MFPQDHPDYARVTCWKAQVPDSVWPMIDIARAYQKHGTLWGAGGLGDQPLWWWNLVTTINWLIDDLDRARESGKPGAFDQAIKDFKSQISRNQHSKGRKGRVKK